MRNTSYRITLSVVKGVICLLMFALTVSAQTLTEREVELFKWRNIGPANFQGRITDIEALDNDFTKVLVAGASGGVWKSDNAGTTWETIFDNYGSASIGDVARSQKNPDIIWVGTGEANNRNSVAWGDGVYKSTDGGETFTNMGLNDTYQIAKIRIHPNNPNTVYVAAIGNLWAYNGTRGVFKTTNGGQTWTKLADGLPDDGKAGATDLVMDPRKPNTLYVAMYDRLRKPWRFDSGSETGGIFKSTNGGKSWKKLTKGLPGGKTGRIGLDIFKKNPNILVAWVEHEFHPNQRRQRDDFDDMSKLGSGIYRSENGGKDWKYLSRMYNRPFYYSQIRIDPNNHQLVYAIATDYSFSDDGGKTFYTISGYGRSGGEKMDIHVDYHAMWIDPGNPNRFYIGNDGGAALTHDRGETFRFFDNINVSQFYAIGVDMRDPYYVYGGLQDNGSWAGVSNSRNTYGILTDHWFKFGGGDGFYSQIDPTDWKTVYGESQGGNIFRFNAETRQSNRIGPNNPSTDPNNRRARKYRFNWSAPILISPHNPRTIYFGGNVLFKSVDRGDNWTVISPDLTTNDSNKKNQYDTGGITLDVTGAEGHCNIVTVAESPLKPGLLWAGTDDGNIQISKNGGVSWENVRSNVTDVPEATWVSRVEASHFDEGTAYVTFDNHRNGDFSTWVYKTSDFGESWENKTNNLPDGNSVYVIKEDHKNKNLLFVGTEFGLYSSIDGGSTWSKFMHNFPTVAVHDLVIHPRDNDLIAGTHGRGIWICDDITSLQQMSEDVLNSDAVLFSSKTATNWLTINKDQGEGWVGSDFYRGENPAKGVNVNYFIKNSVSSVELAISDLTGALKKVIKLAPKSGMNSFRWDMQFDPVKLTDEEQSLFNEMRNVQSFNERMVIREKLQNLLSARGIEDAGIRFSNRGGGVRSGPVASPGEYLVKLTVDGEVYSNTLKVRRDPILDGIK